MNEELLQQAWNHFMSDMAAQEEMIVCTNTCIWLRDNYFPESTIMGYLHDNNPTAIVGESEGGHDFLIIGDVIIDFWQKSLYDEFFPLSLPLADAGKYYGDNAKWETVLPQAA